MEDKVGAPFFREVVLCLNFGLPDDCSSSTEPKFASLMCVVVTHVLIEFFYSVKELHHPIAFRSL